MTKTVTTTETGRLQVVDPRSFDRSIARPARPKLEKLQLNLVVMSETVAPAFREFCRRNAKACPVVATSRRGAYSLPLLGEFDLRSAASQYDIYSFGELVGRQAEIKAFWRTDLVAFALGSSRFLDTTLRERGVRARGGLSRATPRYRTRMRAVGHGPFGGDLVVSMRMVKACDVDRLRAVSARYPQAHGSPVHVGEPEAIGIADIAQPDWGSAVSPAEGDVPVFFASSLTAQDAVARAELSLSITTSPGHMLVTGLDAARQPAAVA